MRRAIGPLIAAAALLAPAAAHAETVSLHGGELLVQAAAGELNQTKVVQSGGNIHVGDDRVQPQLAADSDAGCTSRGFSGILCEIGAVKTIRVALDDGDDDLVVTITAGGAPVTADGGAGRDTVEYVLANGRVAVSFDGIANDGPLPGHDNVTGFEASRGSARDDTLTGGPTADTLFGLEGRDHLNGGAGDDMIDARDHTNCPFLGGCSEPLDQDAPERDTIHCGAGRDTVDGDFKDRIARDCEFAIVDNSLALSNKNDKYTAYRNGMSVHGNGGNDRLTGSSGGPSEDTLDGGKGNDLIEGLLGPDKITGGRGRDRLFSGGGDDTINARDGERDVVNCGQGNDTAAVDKIDTVSANCETVSRR